MRRPPRDPKESLFAGGGLACTCFYGLLIAGISPVSYTHLDVYKRQPVYGAVTISGLALAAVVGIILAFILPEGDDSVLN